MPDLLIVYSSTDGHTRHIGERLRARVQHRASAGGLGPSPEVVLRHLPDCDAADIATASAIVIGASIRYGHHKPEVPAFIARHRQALEARPNAFFSVNVVARKPGKNLPQGNPYLQKFLRSIVWKPQRLAVFGGRIDYPSLKPLDRSMIRFIMWMTSGPTDPTRAFEFTDWAAVDAFGDTLLHMLPQSGPRR